MSRSNKTGQNLFVRIEFIPAGFVYFGMGVKEILDVENKQSS